MEPQSEFLVVQMKYKYIDFMCAKYRIKCVEKNIRVSAANTICHIKKTFYDLCDNWFVLQAKKKNPPVTTIWL